MKFVCPVCGYVEEFDGTELPRISSAPSAAFPVLVS